jgi:hypothetical protein
MTNTGHLAQFTTYGGADGKPLVESRCSCGWESDLYSSSDVDKARKFADDDHASHVAGEEWLAMMRSPDQWL